MGQWTNNGLSLVATAVQTPGAQAAITYVGISTGCGTLATAITSGSPVTSLALNAGLPAALSSSQQLTITDGTNSETVTVAAGGAVQGATSIPINSWTPAHNYAINVTAVAPTPLASDVTLYAETARAPIAATSAGANPGESLINAYFDGTQATGVYITVGYFGGAAATSTPGTGTLMANDIEYWSHTVNADTNMYQGDGII